MPPRKKSEVVSKKRLEVNKEDFIEEVRKYPYLYDLSDKWYKDTTMKDDRWNSIGALFKISGVREAIGPQPELPPSCHGRDSVSLRLPSKKVEAVANQTPASKAAETRIVDDREESSFVLPKREIFVPRQTTQGAAANSSVANGATDQGVTMNRNSRLKLTELNTNMTCVLCQGYFIDATTIVECLHSFCKSCIVKYLETSKFCPICDVQVHKTKPLLHIRSDKTLQDIVYKLVPKAFIDEMRRRREFYEKHPDAGRLTSPEDRGECVEQRVIYDPDENISLSLEYGYGTNQRPETEEQLQAAEKETASDDNAASRRFLLCKAAVRVAHMKKLIIMKYDLTPFYEVDIMYLEEYLEDDLSLMDIAYIYSWRRIGPMRLFYRIRRKVKPIPQPQLQPVIEEITESVPASHSGGVGTLPAIPEEEPEPMEVEESPVTVKTKMKIPQPPILVSASTSTEPKMSKSSKRSASTSLVQTLTIVPPVNPATVKRSASLDDSNGEPRTKRLCLKVAVTDPSKSPSNSSHHSPSSASVTFASPLSSPSTSSSTTSESSSGKSSKHKHKKDKEGKNKESKHHSKHKESSKELLRIKEYLKAQESGTRVKDKSSREGGKSKEHHHHHHHHKNKDGTKGKSSSKTKEPKIKEGIPKLKMATKLKDMPKLTTQTVKIKDMPEFKPVEKEVPVVAKEPPIKIKEILKNKEKYKEVYTFTQNPSKSKELSTVTKSNKDYVKYREFPKQPKVKEKKKDKSHKQRRSSSTAALSPSPTMEVTVTKTFIPPVEQPVPTQNAPVPSVTPVVESPIPEPIVTKPTKTVEEIVEKPTETVSEKPAADETIVKITSSTSKRENSCKIKVATLVIPGFTPSSESPLNSRSLPTSPLYSSLAPPDQVQNSDNPSEVVPKRPSSTPAAISGPEPVVKVKEVKPEEKLPEDPDTKADKDDEAEIPDEADSGRGSDFSSRTEVRSSCDDDIGSPSPTTATTPVSSSTPISVPTTSPPITITVTKTFTPPVETVIPRETGSRAKMMDDLFESAKNEALSRKAVVEVKKYDDNMRRGDKFLSGNIKTYSKASYLTKEVVVKPASPNVTLNASTIPKSVTESVRESQPKPIETIRINLENNQIEKVNTDKKIILPEVVVTRSPTPRPQTVDSKASVTETKKATEPSTNKTTTTTNSSNNNGGNNNGGDKEEFVKKAPESSSSKPEVVQPPPQHKTITISIKTPLCPTVQRTTSSSSSSEDKNAQSVRSPPPPVASPKLAEPPVAAVGNTVASAPSASPPTTASFLQPPVYHSPQHRNSSGSPQYHIYNPHRQFSPPQQQQQSGHHHSGGGKTVKSNKPQCNSSHHNNQPTILPLIVKQNSHHTVTNKNISGVERKRKEHSHPTPSASSGASGCGGSNRAGSPAVSRIPEPTKDNIGALDLSVASRHDRPVTSIPSRQRNLVANPPVLDKHRIATCLQAPNKVPSLKIITNPVNQMLSGTNTPSTSSMTMTSSTSMNLNLPVTSSSCASSSSSSSSSSNIAGTSSSMMKRSDPSRSYHHRSSGKNLTVINQPGGDIPKLVIKSMPTDHHAHHHHNRS